MSKKRKIWLKIFLITSVTFTALLISALFLQSYFYQKNYSVYKQSEFDIAFTEMKKDLRREGSNAENVGRIFRQYRDSDSIWAVFFSVEREYDGFSVGETPTYTATMSEKYTSEELGGYEYSYDFINAIAYYKASLSSLLQDGSPGMFSIRDDFVTASGGPRYIISAQDLLGTGDVLFVMGLAEDRSRLGLVDQYFGYIILFGVLISFVVSYLLSMVLNELIAANAQLEQDIEKERSLERTRKEFIANVSHELKTPLAIIKGYSEAVKDNIRADKKDRYIERIVQEADDMNKLVQDMLDLTHIEAGGYKLQKTDFDLVMLTDHVIQGLQVLASEKDLTIVRNFSAPAVYMNADRIKMRQVVTNFVHNAIRHTPAHGNIEISVTEAGETIRFAVENEGETIQPDKLHKVWERFYREKEDRNKKTGGSGLGLAISATILKLHGMRYAVENTERGVLFWFEYENVAETGT